MPATSAPSLYSHHRGAAAHMSLFGNDVRTQRDTAWQENAELRQRIAELEFALAALTVENERLRDVITEWASP